MTKPEFWKLNAALTRRGVRKDGSPRATNYRTLKLHEDGLKAIAMRAAGRSTADILLRLRCSRARLYRAMSLARASALIQTEIDPLLS